MPFTLFCHLNSPNDAAQFFREQNSIFEGENDKWSATYTFPGKFLQKKKFISFTYDKQWCSPPNWPQQILGMTNYISSFQMEDEIRSKVMNLISQFEFTIGIVNEPEISDDKDPRLDVMHSLAEHMQGCFFTPEAMLDASFRAFAAADGNTTLDAIVPIVAEENFSEDDNEGESEPPLADRIAQRMYVMVALAARGLFEMNLQQGRTPAYSLNELHGWFESLSVAHELESKESEILYASEQQLNQQDCVNCVWTLEAIVVLAWSLKLTTMPPYDQLVEVDALLSEISFLDVNASKQKIANASLRPVQDLDSYDREIFAYDWRMVDYRVHTKSVDYANVKIGSKTFNLNWARLIDGDLALQSKRIDMADEDLFGAMCSLASERHKASNWLQGYATRYADTSSDT